MRICPVCNIALKSAHRSGVAIEYCAQCRGVWLDRGELDKIIKRSAKHPVERARPDHETQQKAAPKSSEEVLHPVRVYPPHDMGTLTHTDLEELFDFEE